MGGSHSQEYDLETDKDQKDEQPVPNSTDDPSNVDVMISYSRTDGLALAELKKALQRNGLAVWTDTSDITSGSDFLSKIGQAIIDCKVFVCLLSPASVQSKYCQDELALAYVSNKPIFPVALQKSQDLMAVMDTGMRLQLARFKWQYFLEPSEYEKRFNELLEEVKKVVGEIRPDMSKGISRQSSMKHGDSDQIAKMASFWEDNFGDQTEVQWSVFIKHLMEKHREQIENLFTVEKDRIWFISLIHRELKVSRNVLQKTNFDEFCHDEKGDFYPFWLKAQDKAVENFTIREVFDMDSSVRVEAIENLGKFKSPAVIDALTSLLSDEDCNVIAVAAISLAKTGTKTKKVVAQLLEMLSNKDRLVREAGCLALGHLQVDEAVPKLLNLWRNDFISHVREAASVALHQIGGEEANRAIHMTNVLSNEIKMLANTD